MIDRSIDQSDALKLFVNVQSERVKKASNLTKSLTSFPFVSYSSDRFASRGNRIKTKTSVGICFSSKKEISIENKFRSCRIKENWTKRWIWSKTSNDDTESSSLLSINRGLYSKLLGNSSARRFNHNQIFRPSLSADLRVEMFSFDRWFQESINSIPLNIEIDRFIETTQQRIDQMRSRMLRDQQRLRNIDNDISVQDSFRFLQRIYPKLDEFFFALQQKRSA